MIDLADFETVELRLRRPLLVIRGDRGVLACGYLSVDALEKNGDAAAIVRGVDSLADALAAEVRQVTSGAAELGVAVGMTGAEALDRFR